MDDQTPHSIDRGRTKWTPTMDRHFIDIMLEQVHAGNKINNTFRKKAWLEMVELFNAKSGLQLDKEVLRNRSKKLRMQFNAVKILLNHNGFHWDETRNMVTADKDVWIDYLKVHPEALSYKSKTMPLFSDLCVIYGNETADGIYNPHNASLIENSVIMTTDGVSGDVHSSFLEDDSVVRCSQLVARTPVGVDRSRTNWTQTMDRYFIGIMMDQVLKGNKNGNVFRKKAWKQMVVSFNTNFGLQLDKEVLRNRAKKLRIQYIGMKMLLDKPGFHWDETRQMVTADDNVWDEYVKAHPGARSYRTKTLPDYNDLCVIYGGEISNGRCNNNLDPDNHNALVKKDEVSEGSQSPPTSSKHENQRVAFQPVEGRFDNRTPSSYDRSKTNWTPPMDNYFIEIMIEHVQKGYKIGKTFHREAWAYMIALFNARFGLQLDKDVLKNRYKKLRTQYCAMRTLLSNSGFHWDETRQLVTADDYVWDDYLKKYISEDIPFYLFPVSDIAYMQAHPEARSYRTRTVPDYNHLSVIYGDTSAEGRYNFSESDMNLKSIPITRIESIPIMRIEGFGTQQSLILPSAQEDVALGPQESSHSGGSMDILNHRIKRPFETSTSQHSRKLHRSSDEGMLAALREMTVAVTMLANKKKENEASISLDTVVNALNATPELEEDLFLDACDFLEDEQKAKMFLALDVSIRKKWLMRKLRPEKPLAADN